VVINQPTGVYRPRL